MNDMVICWTPFNSFIFPFKGWIPGRPHPALQREWIEARYKVWRDFTYQSIKNQTEKKFVYLICCNLLSKSITDQVFDPVIKTDPRVVLFYHGTPEYLKTVKTIREQYETTYATRIDSDDAYGSDTFEYILREFPEDQQYGFFLKGFGYRPATRQLWRYNCCKSGPFYVVKYPKGMYRYDPIDHNYIKIAGATVLEEGHFIVNAHEANHSTTARPPYFESELPRWERDTVLRRFGVK